MIGPDSTPDDTDAAARAGEPACPQCGGPRYRGAYGVTCPRCLLSATDHASAADQLGAEIGSAAEESDGERARRFDRFEIMLRPDRTWWELGQGSLGVTYRALEIDTLQPVALKRIVAGGSAGPVAPASVLQHAMEIAKLQHSNVARLIHFGSNADGTSFLVTELAEGESLAQLVPRAGPLPASIALEVAGQIVHAFEAAGERGIRHRDLRPAKVMLCDAKGETSPMVKVMDFGFVDCFHRGREFRGTAGFASPEQAAGREVDVRADYFALGATLYFALSGQTPQPVSSPPKPTDPKPSPRVHFTPLRERGVPEEFIAWLRRLLDPNPAGRPRDAFELVESLAALRLRLRRSKAAPSPARSETARWWNRWFASPRK